jgi:hypothetical protein
MTDILEFRTDAPRDESLHIDSRISERAQRISSGNSQPGDFDEMNALTRQRAAMAVSRSTRDRLVRR